MLYEAIRELEAAGETPVMMVGVDFNQNSIAATTQKCASKGVPLIAVQGDISNPAAITKDLQAAGIDTNAQPILHVRTFLDHDRPYIAPTSEPRATDGARCRGVYVQPEDGSLLDPALVMRSLIEHFERWACILETGHHLVILEVHAMSAEAAGIHRKTSVSLNFDATQGFSGQLLVPAAAFFAAAAEAALHPVQETMRFPSHEPFTRITLNSFEKRDYRIRVAESSDLAQLELLEQECWALHLQQDRAALQKRLDCFGEGQLVLEVGSSHSGWEVAGSLYTQRLSSVQQLEHAQYCSLPSVHCAGGSVLQLISIQISQQHTGNVYGSALRDHALALASLDDSIESVVGVTRCRQYAVAVAECPGLSMMQHVENGDIGVQFHTARGAHVRYAVPEYRPEDTENGGVGVLIEYC